VTDRVGALAIAQQHPWGLATRERCDALIALARGERVEGAIEQTHDAATTYLALGLRFDQARTLRAGGRQLRRLRKWGASRDLLEEAVTVFGSIGSQGWADDARADIGRLGGRDRPPKGALTAAERQVAVLAAEGRSNKEIAAALVVGVSTVETHLRACFRQAGRPVANGIGEPPRGSINIIDLRD